MPSENQYTQTFYFYPRSPCGERPIAGRITSKGTKISIHALLAESDAFDVLAVSAVLISIHALLAESDEGANSLADAPPQISIHALLAESDERRHKKHLISQVISIHALLAESDASNQPERQGQHDFYPRSPCGERPNRAGLNIRQIQNFYPRSPCGERQ